jgi:hypothetical protein
MVVFYNIIILVQFLKLVYLELSILDLGLKLKLYLI